MVAVAWVAWAPGGDARDARADTQGSAATTDEVPVASPDGLLLLQDRPLEPPPTALAHPPFSEATVPRLALGLGTGLGSPLGYLSASAEFQPWSWLALQAGVGLGGRFGPATSEMIRFALPLGPLRQGLGLGLSQNYLVRSNDYDGYPGAPDVAQFFNAEAFFDIFASEHFAVRLAGGFAVLMNRNDYATMCGRNVSACSSRSSGNDPWSAGVAAAQQGDYILGYASLDLMWSFDLGSPRQPSPEATSSGHSP